MNKDIDKMISSYIEGDISNENKIIIENYIKDNPDFSLKIDSVKKIMNSLHETPCLSPSENFLTNLDAKITNSDIKSNYWFATNFKTTLAFSFVLTIIAVFIFNNTDNDNQNIVTEHPKEQVQNEHMFVSDSLTNDFPIHQVDYNK